MKNAVDFDKSWLEVDQDYLLPERELLQPYLNQLGRDYYDINKVRDIAVNLIESARRDDQPLGVVQSLLQKYELGSEEGVTLMCLGEALLRIPDSKTLDRFIAESLVKGNWRDGLSQSDSLFMHASAYALFLSGKILEPKSNEDWNGVLGNWLKNASAGVIRGAVKEVMQLMGRQFILSESIGAALKHLSGAAASKQRYSFDMLGESALCQADAEIYLQRYRDALSSLAMHAKADQWWDNPGLSIKLSALEPRFSALQCTRVEQALLDKLVPLIQLAAASNIGVTIDAEECDSLYFGQRIFYQLYLMPEFRHYNGLGVVVQAYQKRAPMLLNFLQRLWQQGKKSIPVRLVKGAYWDSEIKLAQKVGLSGYPVWTRKAHTDVCFLHCLNQLFKSPAFIAQIATHNAMTAAAAIALAQSEIPAYWELQRLHGMGESLYRALAEKYPDVALRTYAPIGGYKELLPYLVRRMLENGANTSFVNRFKNKRLPVRYLTQDPCRLAYEDELQPHARIPIPANIYLPQRNNATTVNLSSLCESQHLSQQLAKFEQHEWVFDGEDLPQSKQCTSLYSQRYLGRVYCHRGEDLQRVLDNAGVAQRDWLKSPLRQRIECISRFAALLQQHQYELIYLIVREAGRCVADALSELQEAQDFCYYYNSQARETLSEAKTLPAVAGERNQLYLPGRGIFVCISPWNFPLAIYCGQIVAALLAGNAVIAKSASATPLLSARVCQLLHQAGIPDTLAQHVNAAASDIETHILSSPQVAGVVFTGSLASARQINQCMARRNGAIAKFIAETGGINAMLADSSALPEQLVKDVITSAFNSAGQRCSALRVLFLQSDIADRVLQLLIGACDELNLGDPLMLDTDIGPMIDQAACDKAEQHLSSFDASQIIYRYALVEEEKGKGLFAPAIVELNELTQIPGEIFAPIIHVYRYRSETLDAMIDYINSLGYGLTLGVHSRLDSTLSLVAERANVGNVYINRDMIGASVGVQPFGGQGLSGTGPKAGGPNYLQAFVTEKVVTTNTAAIGGNISLLLENES